MYLNMQQTYVSRGPAVTEHVHQTDSYYTDADQPCEGTSSNSNNHHALSHDTVAQGVQEHSNMGRSH